MHTHFKPPHIEMDRNIPEARAAAQWVMLVNLWWAFRNARTA